MAHLENDQHELFALYLVYGHPDPDGPDTTGNAPQAYKAVYGCQIGSARSGAHRLMEREDVRARVRELRKERAAQLKASAPEWGELYPDAIQTIREAAKGSFRGDDDSGRTRLRAAIHIVDRVEGTVQEMHRLAVDGANIVVGVAGPEHKQPQELPQGNGREIEGEAREEELDPFASWFEDDDEELPELSEFT